MSVLPCPLPPLPPPFSAKELSAAALAGFFFLAGAWKLSAAEQLLLLGQPARSTFFAWKKDPNATLSRDTLERISYLLGIWKALRILIPDEPQALAWISKPNDNPLFAGQTPLSHMLQGRILDLADVRRLLDARRGVW